MSEETVTISKKLYISLVEDEFELMRLNDAGVDNWPGCDYAYGGMDEDFDYDQELAKWKTARGLTD